MRRSSPAPFEVLLAADDVTPKKLADEGHAVAASRFTYATGRLVLCSGRPGFVGAPATAVFKAYAVMAATQG